VSNPSLPPHIATTPLPKEGIVINVIIPSLGWVKEGLSASAENRAEIMALGGGQRPFRFACSGGLSVGKAKGQK